MLLCSRSSSNGDALTWHFDHETMAHQVIKLGLQFDKVHPNRILHVSIFIVLSLLFLFISEMKGVPLCWLSRFYFELLQCIFSSIQQKIYVIESSNMCICHSKFPQYVFVIQQTYICLFILKLSSFQLPSIQVILSKCRICLPWLMKIKGDKYKGV